MEIGLQGYSCGGSMAPVREGIDRNGRGRVCGDGAASAEIPAGPGTSRGGRTLHSGPD